MTLFQRSIKERQRSLLSWAVGAFLLSTLYVVIYPSIKDVFAEIDEFPDELLEALGLTGGVDLGSPAGYLTAELFSITAPIILIVFAVVIGVGAIAGSERKGEMQLLLANPISRSTVLTQRFASMLVLTLLLGMVIWVALAAGIVFDVWPELSLWNLIQQVIALVLLGWAFGAIGLSASAASGNTGLSYAVVGALAVVTFVLNSFSQIVEELEPLKWITPFQYYTGNNPLVEGMVWWHAIVLLGIVAVAYVTGRYLFDHRDLK